VDGKTIIVGVALTHSAVFFFHTGCGCDADLAQFPDSVRGTMANLFSNLALGFQVGQFVPWPHRRGSVGRLDPDPGQHICCV